MNGDDLKDRRQGDSARETAKRYNLVNRMVRAYRGGLQGSDGGPVALDNDPCDIPTLNSTTNSISQYGVLATDGPVVSPTNSASAFQLQELGIIGVTPTAPQFLACFGIAQAPIAPNAVGPVRYSGVSRVQVNILSTNHATADITDGDPTMLTSCDGGAAQILYAQSESAGIQWAIVRIGTADPLPSPELAGLVLVSKADKSWSAGVLPLNDTNRTYPQP